MHVVSAADEQLLSRQLTHAMVYADVPAGWPLWHEGPLYGNAPLLPLLPLLLLLQASGANAAMTPTTQTTFLIGSSSRCQARPIRPPN